MSNFSMFSYHKPIVSETEDYFKLENKGYFYLADTVWNAFLNCSLQEWEEYLVYRKAQNFNALQISILPIIHDASQSKDESLPFKLDEKGNWDFYHPNEPYFDKAEKMVKMAREKGFTPSLVVLWCNYVNGTWASRKVDPSYIMPLEAVQSYVSYVVNRFKKYSPIYLVSGDTNFPDDEALCYFKIALDEIKSIDKDGLTTFHLQPHVDLHHDFVVSDKVDFYMYQSGHHKNQELPYQLAEHFRNKKVKRPVVNGEPCYEGHGYGRSYGRFHSFDVRKAIWQSLLSGAKAGFTYGAHGLWSWHHRGDEFNNKEFSDIPFDWRSALRLDGAWDVSFAKWLFECYNMFELNPVPKILNQTNEIRMASSKDNNKMVIYAPYLTEIEVNHDLTGYDVLLVDLKERNFMKPEVIVKKNISFVQMYDLNTDILLIAQRKE